jgi:dihydroorotate dehydrogenase (fumarate)
VTPNQLLILGVPGPNHLIEVQQGLEQWMEDQSFESVADVRGRVSQLTVADPTEFARANYVKVLDSYKANSGVWI